MHADPKHFKTLESAFVKGLQLVGGVCGEIVQKKDILLSKLADTIIKVRLSNVKN